MNNKNLNELAIQYKKSKDPKILDELFILLEPKIKKKVNFIYSKLKFYKLDWKDIKQELYLKILQIINEYDPKQPFENYYYSSLKTWNPVLSTEDTTNYEPLYQIDEETGGGTEERFESKTSEKSTSNLTIEDILNECKTEDERKVCELLLENPTFSQDELAEKLGTYQRNISRTINKLRKRLKNICLKTRN